MKKIHKPGCYETNLVFLLPPVVVASYDTDGLQGLAQSHVITQYTMKIVLVQESQPVYTILEISKAKN